MRHYLCHSTAPLTPTTHALGMFKASSATLLVTPAGRALQHLVDVNYPDRSATTILAGGSGE
jgi:hypothetical protein